MGFFLVLWLVYVGSFPWISFICFLWEKIHLAECKQVDSSLGFSRDFLCELFTRPLAWHKFFPRENREHQQIGRWNSCWKWWEVSWLNSVKDHGLQLQKIPSWKKQDMTIWKCISSKSTCWKSCFFLAMLVCNTKRLTATFSCRKKLPKWTLVDYETARVGLKT